MSYTKFCIQCEPTPNSADSQYLFVSRCFRQPALILTTAMMSETKLHAENRCSAPTALCPREESVDMT